MEYSSDFREPIRDAVRSAYDRVSGIAESLDLLDDGDMHMSHLGSIAINTMYSERRCETETFVNVFDIANELLEADEPSEQLEDILFEMISEMLCASAARCTDSLAIVTPDRMRMLEEIRYVWKLNEVPRMNGDEWRVFSSSPGRRTDPDSISFVPNETGWAIGFKRTHAMSYVGPGNNMGIVSCELVND